LLGIFFWWLTKSLTLNYFCLSFANHIFSWRWLRYEPRGLIGLCEHKTTSILTTWCWDVVIVKRTKYYTYGIHNEWWWTAARQRWRRAHKSSACKIGDHFFLLLPSRVGRTGKSYQSDDETIRTYTKQRSWRKTDEMEKFVDHAHVSNNTFSRPTYCRNCGTRVGCFGMPRHKGRRRRTPVAAFQKPSRAQRPFARSNGFRAIVAIGTCGCVYQSNVCNK